MHEDASLRNGLALERTALANERTLLSYGRTALGLVGLAVFIFKFSSPEIAMIGGSLSLTAALFVFFWGMRTYQRTAERISEIPTSSDESQLAFSEIE